MRAARIAIVSSLLAMSGCLPADKCDPGETENHGACFPPAPMSDGGPLLDAAADSDAGARVGNPAATFGTPCASQSDCGGAAPACAAPRLPYCTALDCLQKPGACPQGWQCFDTRSISTVQGIDSLCLRI